MLAYLGVILALSWSPRVGCQYSDGDNEYPYSDDHVYFLDSHQQIDDYLLEVDLHLKIPIRRKSLLYTLNPLTLLQTGYSRYSRSQLPIGPPYQNPGYPRRPWKYTRSI